MKVFRNLEALPPFQNTVLTIGSYDGVHAGHQHIIRRINDLARQSAGESVLITFHPHPRLVVYPNAPSLKLITTIEEKIELLAQYKIDNLAIIPFTKRFSELSPKAYIHDFLYQYFHPKHIVIGYDHRFGNQRKGNLELLKSYEKSLEYEVEEISKQEVDNIAVSSTKIRQALLTGNIEVANTLLQHRFTLQGIVVHGEKIGHQIGFPTANIDVQNSNKIIPQNGIYAVFAYHHHTRYKAMLYIGNRPTLEGINQSIEVNLFGFDKKIYGDLLKIELVAYLRDDIKFENLNELQAQLERDKIAALECLNNIE